MPKALQYLTSLAALVIAAALCLLAYQGARQHSTPELLTPYQAVALNNGQVFFGHLSGMDSSYLVLRDVFYIQTRQNPDTRQTANVLIKRGAEAHAPDRMLINRQQLLLVEPVGETSQIAKLIAAQNGGR